MAEHQILAHKVTKPIQLLAAWLVGLLLIDGMFLASALKLEQSWERAALILAAIVNVPMFLAALFVLQTRFRAELQEDTFYSEYLSKKTEGVYKLETSSAPAAKIEAVELKRISGVPAQAIAEANSPQSRTSPLDWSKWRVALNERHPQVEEIRQSLRDAEIPLAEFFGKNSADGKDPTHWVVSINERMPIEHISGLLRILGKFDFDGFQLWEPVLEADETEDVYIGSFGDESFTSITDGLRELLETGELEWADLERYQRNNRKKARQAG